MTPINRMNTISYNANTIHLLVEYFLILYRYHSIKYICTKPVCIYRQAFHIQVQFQCSDDQTSCLITALVPKNGGE